MDIVFNIVIMLLILSVLISIHEAGHLATAKLFNIYCFEYSIGFGPKLLHKKRKGGETYFSIRVIPMGGFVSMYGEAEDIELEPGETLPPPERSIEGVAKWKKAIVLAAGVVLNFLLGLLLIFVSVSCFPQFYSAYSVTSGRVGESTSLFAPINPSEDSYTYGVIDNGKTADYGVTDYEMFMGFDSYTIGEVSYGPGYILDSGAKISWNDSGAHQMDVVAMYSPSLLTSDHDLASDVYFFPIDATKTMPQEYKDFGIDYLPNFGETESTQFVFQSTINYTVTMDLTVVPLAKREETTTFADRWADKIDIPYTITYSNGTPSGNDMRIAVISEWNSWQEIGEKWCYYVPYCCGAIVKGIASLFTPSGWQNLSGIVGMTSMVGTYNAMGGASMIFLFAGLISINLSFFNLLPFPGLDGYQLVVTAIEGLFRRKLPKKFKTIMTVIGYVILIGLFVAITIKDIIAL